jgi:hypothetical protein
MNDCPAHVRSKLDLINARRYFFEQTLLTLKTLPTTTEALFGFDADFVAPRLLSMDAEFGSLIIQVTPNFMGEGDESQYYYSICAMGDILRIGIFMPISRILTAPIHGEGREQLIQTWNGVPFSMHDRGLGVLYEWTFSDFDASDWRCAEKYILGMRRLHLRFLSLVHDTVHELIRPTLLHN